MSNKLATKETTNRKARAGGGGGGQIPTPHIVDKHALQEARAAARKKADEVFQHEMEKITRPLDDQLASLTARRDQLETELRNLEGDIAKLRKARSDVLGIEDKPAKTAVSGKRERKSEEQLQAIAKSMAEFIKRQPEPISGGAIRDFLDQFHAGYKIQSALTFLDKYFPDHGVKSEGHKAATRYH
jgi:septal ring factor EnvC (AmiA/AmiB activator)